VSDVPSHEELAAENAELKALVVRLMDRIADLERRLGSDSSNSSRPPSSDAPWNKKPAKTRSLRGGSGLKPGKQKGAGSSSRKLTDDPNVIKRLEPHRCKGCDGSLADAADHSVERRQVIDIEPPPPPSVTEYRRVSKMCHGCGEVTTPGWDTDDENTVVVDTPGSPVRIGPRTLARAAFLTCAHFLPVGRARLVLATLTGIAVSTGLVAGVRGRAARRLEKRFLPHLRDLLAAAPVLHADETTGRAAAALSYVHVACTEYLTCLHVGGRSADDIDAGGILPGYTGVLVRDGYAGYAHLPATHAWCAAHLLRDLRSVSDADPDHQVWALSLVDVLLDAHQAAITAREQGRDIIDPAVLKTIRNHYLGALSLGTDENRGRGSELAKRARTLVKRFRRFEDMILRFATDLTVPFTNNTAERAVRGVKVQQRTSGGGWRTLQGLIDFAVVHSYLDTAHKWGIDKLDALQRLFVGNPWLPPALAPG
jgi:transposase